MLASISCRVPLVDIYDRVVFPDIVDWKEPLMPIHDHLYGRDFVAWCEEQSDHLLREDWFALDWANLADEIRSLGLRDRRALGQHIQNLLTHLLLYVYQPTTRAEGTDQARSGTILHLRQAIASLVEDSPSLARSLPGVVTQRYPHAVKFAANFGRLAMATFPETCPWTTGQVLDDDFYPEPRE
jgi:hypothetical protein